jgi:hypothetical protein
MNIIDERAKEIESLTKIVFQLTDNRRFDIAKAAMQGLLGQHLSSESGLLPSYSTHHFQSLVKRSVELADMLLSELAKPIAERDESK